MAVLTSLAALLAAGGPALADDAGASDDASRTTIGIKTAGPHGPDERNSYHYSLSPGGRVRDYIAISNFSLHRAKLRLLARDATSTPDAPFTIQPSETMPTDVGAWIGISNPSITIPARSQVIVPFQMRIPANATPGDHVGAVLISLLSKAPDAKAGGVVVDNRVGLRFYLRVSGAVTPRLSVSGLTTKWDGSWQANGGGDVTVDYTVHNTGNVRMSSDQKIAIKGSWSPGSYVASPAPIQEILPGGELHVSQVFHNVFGTGPMRATVTLQPSELSDSGSKAAPEVVASVDFQAWPWLPILLVIGLLLLVFSLGGWFFRRHRRGQALTVVQDSPADDGAPAAALVRGLLAVAFAGGFALLGAHPAYADPADAPVWQATIEPSIGLGNSPVEVTTTGGCPAPATNVVGLIYGAGFPREGGVAVANGDAGVRSDGPFTLPLASSLSSLMAMQDRPTTLHGDYKIALSCIEPGSPLDSLGQFVVAIRFDNPDRWHVLQPLTHKHGIKLDTAPSPGTPVPEVGGANPTGNASPGSPTAGAPGDSTTDASSGATSPGDSTTHAGNGDGTSSSAPFATSSSNDLSWVLWAGGGAVAVLVVAWFIATRPDQTL